MVKLILLYDLFIFCHNLITWLIPEQCHICSLFQVLGQWHDRKKWLSNEARERDQEPGTG